MYTKSWFLKNSISMNNHSSHYVYNFNQELVMPYIGLILVLCNAAYYLYNLFL